MSRRSAHECQGRHLLGVPGGDLDRDPRPVAPGGEGEAVDTMVVKSCYRVFGMSAWVDAVGSRWARTEQAAVVPHDDRPLTGDVHQALAPRCQVRAYGVSHE